MTYELPPMYPNPLLPPLIVLTILTMRPRLWQQFARLFIAPEGVMLVCPEAFSAGYILFTSACHILALVLGAIFLCLFPINQTKRAYTAFFFYFF